VERRKLRKLTRECNRRQCVCIIAVAKHTQDFSVCRISQVHEMSKIWQGKVRISRGRGILLIDSGKEMRGRADNTSHISKLWTSSEC